MEIVIEDINLVDDTKATGGKAFEGETLADFIEESAKENKIVDLTTINNELQECGIEPISSDQIVFKATKTEGTPMLRVYYTDDDGNKQMVKALNVDFYSDPTYMFIIDTGTDCLEIDVDHFDKVETDEEVRL